MSHLTIRRLRESRKFPRDEGHYNEQIIQLKRQRSSHIAQLTKTINKVSNLIECGKSFEEVVKCNDLLEISIKAIRDITSKIIRHETDDKITEKELNIGTEQEFRLIQIRKLIDSYCVNVENISPFKNTPFKDTSFTSDKGKQMSISSTKSAPILNKTPRNILDQHERFSLPSLRQKANSSSVSQDGGSKASYYPVLERRRTTEHAKLSVKQNEEKIQHKLELLEKSFEYEREKLLQEAIEARHQVELVEVDSKYEGSIVQSSVRKKVNPVKTNLGDKILEIPFSSMQIENPVYRKTNIEPGLKDISDKTSRNAFLNQRKIIDSFIDHLVEGQETNFSSTPSEFVLEAKLAIQRDFESRNLPPIPLCRFNGNSSNWPEFIECFYSRVHCKRTFDDNMRMTRLLSVLDGEAKKAVETIGTSGIFYATALKTLKRDFGSPLLISHFRLKNLFDKPQIRANDRITLRQFHQELKLTNTWLMSVDYKAPIFSSDNLTKAIIRLPYQLRQRFYKFTKESNLIDGSVNLVTFEKWLEDQLKTSFNPLADIIIDKEHMLKNRYQSGRLPTRQSINSLETDINVNNVNYSSHGSKEEESLNENKTEKTRTLTCWLCKNNHRLMNCKDFLAKTPAERNNFVFDNKLCFNCLSKGHQLNDCKSDFRCREENCNRKHHTLLHQDLKAGDLTINNCNIDRDIDNTTYLQIIPVTIHNNNDSVRTWALLDTGSDATLISEEIAHNLKLKGEMRNISVSNVMSMENKLPSKLVNFSVSSNSHPERVNIRNAWVVKDLKIQTKKMDTKNIVAKYPYLADIAIDTQTPSGISMLIGADQPHLHLYTAVRKRNPNEPVALQTTLGWVVMGGNKGSSNQFSTNKMSINAHIDNIVQRFWDLESYGTTETESKSIMTEEEHKAVKRLETTTHVSNNHYTIGLLWKDSNVTLPNNRSLAVSRFLSLENKLNKKPELKKRYTDTIHDYINKGHATKLTPENAKSTSKITNYIPHHAVFNINKPSKLRVVFDAAAKYRGTSLNENLLKGPDLLSSLIGIILRFRMNEFAVMGDIEQMFHQVNVPTADRDALRFLWRDNVKHPIEDYIMNVHLFGKKDSPCCSQWALKQTVLEKGCKYPQRVSDAILEHFYVDDYLDSFVSEQEAIDIVCKVRELLSSRGFNLTKFLANSHSILKSLPNSVLSPKLVDLDLDKIPLERALGVLWDPNEDVLKVKVVYKEVPNTKRGILSFTSSIFDPLGMISPAILEPKLLMQELWKRNIDWDELIPLDILTRWNIWKQSIRDLNDVKIERWYKFFSTNPVELHIFADASEKAYGAVAYIKTIINGNVSCNFVLAKSRLTPINKPSLTIPRLELEAALIAARLVKTILQEIKIPVSNVSLWSDSTTVLKYIKNGETQFEKYVLRRTHEINSITNSENWNYIESNLNVADDLTKCINLAQFNNNHRWFHAPDFLYNNNDNYVFQDKNETVTTNNQIIQNAPRITESNQNKLLDWSRYSSWEKLVRVTARIVRFKNNLLHKIRYKILPQNSIHLTRHELKTSELEILRLSQKESFSEDLCKLAKNKQLASHSKLISLNPYLDTDNLMKVNGRVKSTEIFLNNSDQVILSKTHPISKLIISHYHKLSLHSGREQTLASVRERFWIPACRGLIKQVINSCPLCKFRSVKPQQPIMSKLPNDRLSVGEKPFSKVGVDYFGPLVVKLSKRTRSNQATAKRYGVLFTCLTTRAVHLEIAGDMSTDSFILALRRFISRRGPIDIIRSDNGTNFVGAEKELRNALKELDQTLISSELNRYRIEWKFNPPSSPWMGGVWESLVKSVKRTLKVITRDRVFTEESLYTFLCEVESVINNRPLTPTSDNISDFEALTPNHFLLGAKVTNYAPGSFNYREINYRKKWRAVQAALNMFWTRWLREYLPSLVNRKKWTTNSRNLEIGDLVILVSKNPVRSVWLTGRVIETYPGVDGVVRSVKVKTPNNEVVRPAASLCLLEAVS